MANHASAEKRARQTVKRTARNRAARTHTRNAIKRVRTAVTAGDKKAAQEALKGCVQLLDRAVTKGLMHRATSSRTISRLTSHVHKLG
jgi:small subunit ribosomal protein S20